MHTSCIVQRMYAVTCKESDERTDEVYIGYASGRLLTMTDDNTLRPVTYCNKPKSSKLAMS